MPARVGKLRVKIAAIRNWTASQQLSGDDVIMFADSYDVVIFAGEDEILRRFLVAERRLNRSLIFNGERYCYPGYGRYCQAQARAHEEGPHMNSGLWVGRASSVLKMLKTPVVDSRPGSDQQWYQDYCVDNPWEIGVDNTKEFLLATHDEDVRIEGGRIHFNGLEKLPVAAHFVSFAHWPRYNSAMNGYTLSVV